MFKEKLNKKLAFALAENSFEFPNELQLKCIPKINAGADVIAVAPANSGKSTLVAISAIQKLQYAFEDPPRALILVADKQKALVMFEQIKLLTIETDLRLVMVTEEGKIDVQTTDIYSGTDIIIGTANRIMEIYFKRTLNLNKIKLFVIDDAQSMIENRWQGQIDRLALSLPKCQHLVFTEIFDHKIQKLISKFIVAPFIFEIDK